MRKINHCSLSHRFRSQPVRNAINQHHHSFMNVKQFLTSCCFTQEKTMNKTIYRAASLIVALAMILGNIIHTQAAGSVYYVSPTGNDANPGTSSAPFKTFAKANSMLTAGSTLYIYAGIYNEQLKISKSGTSSAWITVKPQGGIVVIDMKNAVTIGVSLSASYVTVSGLEVKNSGDICVNLVGNN